MTDRNSSSQPRSFSLGLYLLIVFGISWPFQIISAVLARSMLPVFILNATSMIMVTVGTYIAGRYVFRDGFAEAGWRWGKLKHHLVVIGLVMLLFVFPTLVRVVMGSVSFSSFLQIKVIWLFVLPLVILIPGFGEEFGWRGYMLPRMARSMGERKAVFWHSVIWWAWHLPILIGSGVQAGILNAAEMGVSVPVSIGISVFVLLAIGAIPTILHGVIFAYIWFRSRSLAVATVYHATYDGVRDSLSWLVGISPMVGIWLNVLLVILGIILLWKGDWKGLAEGAPTDQKLPSILEPAA